MIKIFFWRMAHEKPPGRKTVKRVQVLIMSDKGGWGFQIIRACVCPL